MILPQGRLYIALEGFDFGWEPEQVSAKKYPFRGSGNTCQLHFTTTQGGETSEA